MTDAVAKNKAEEGGENAKMSNVKLSNLQAEEDPLGLRPWFRDREKSLLLHRLRFHRLYLHPEA
jgi:hypothetical protein